MGSSRIHSKEKVLKKSNLSKPIPFHIMSNGQPECLPNWDLGFTLAWENDASWRDWGLSWIWWIWLRPSVERHWDRKSGSPDGNQGSHSDTPRLSLQVVCFSVPSVKNRKHLCKWTAVSKKELCSSGLCCYWNSRVLWAGGVHAGTAHVCIRIDRSANMFFK